ncbi:hypothetical protein Salat_0048200 [Sesamum alatum]|uniref:Pectinesterase inhibitor domain-containing protein n=1 Tax=Sesamum alatum TaxID=300844 RepID=A0AAE1YWN3_9LAMI|nr:hypothetical protein Salat_0048200 [Sesamum alatum]
MALMSSYNSLSYSFIFYLLLVGGQCLTTAALLEDVCRKAQDQAFCLTLLGNDPRSRNADAPLLAQIALDLASASAKATKPRIDSLHLYAKDPQLKTDLEQCQKYYTDALNALNNAVAYLKKADYRSLNVEAEDVYNGGHYCQDAFKPPKVSPLTNENNALSNYADIIGVISNMAYDHILDPGLGDKAECRTPRFELRLRRYSTIGG